MQEFFAGEDFSVAVFFTTRPQYFPVSAPGKGEIVRRFDCPVQLSDKGDLKKSANPITGYKAKPRLPFVINSTDNCVITNARRGIPARLF
jgi:hypothetical protein